MQPEKYNLMTKIRGGRYGEIGLHFHLNVSYKNFVVNLVLKQYYKNIYHLLI